MARKQQKQLLVRPVDGAYPACDYEGARGNKRGEMDATATKQGRYHPVNCEVLTMNRAVFFILPVFYILLTTCTPTTETDLERIQLHLPERVGTNVIVVSFDALRADALGVYGGPPDGSPTLDEFARECAVFDRAYTVAPVTPTSFASAFTGLLPTRVFHRWQLISEETLAKAFADSGYRTAAFINNAQLTEERNFNKGFETYNIENSRPDETILAKSLKWLSANRHEKIFTWIHFLAPHAPYRYRELASHLYEEGYTGRFEKTSGIEFDTDDPAEINRIKSLYRGEVLYADTLFRKLLLGLRESGFLENSTILVTSDHGEEFKEHGGFQHGRLTEEHVRVPLLIYHPDVRTHFKTDLLVSNVDFFPTLTSIAGITTDLNFDGRDLTRLTDAPRWIAGVSMTAPEWRWVSLRDDRYRLIQTCQPTDERQLFDLHTDPGELSNIRANEPLTERSLYRDLGIILGGEPCKVLKAAVRAEDPTVGLSEETVRAIKALGYLGD